MDVIPPNIDYLLEKDNLDDENVEELKIRYKEISEYLENLYPPSGADEEAVKEMYEKYKTHKTNMKTLKARIEDKFREQNIKFVER